MLLTVERRHLYASS